MPLVTVEEGILKGAVCEEGDTTYIAFKGIPYAKPPIGNLRFKAPEPPEAWTGERDATQHGPVCPQYNERLDCIEEGSEDCLYLNIFTKTLDPLTPRPVMVWIHGGGFYTGSGNSDYYGPEFLIKHDVILVTFNYRLEVLGFLCLDNEEVPGNAGLKDQVAALSNPTPTTDLEPWKPFKDEERNVYIIGQDLKCTEGEDAKNIQLWEEIYGEIVLQCQCPV
ncbi:juvenile hormone esterase isoform X2 [Plodia interpunctella]|uniref:juvenile hormone esterase isoform X2 n=1 Tax=Plodia interpunctella TaxID=58824 RepID=UPI003100CE0F